ncbi:hypothetical protein K493DRAFT_345465 [Basidiobolus meristosporus CBS 931.73]|uniref:Yeast cell wall synthesis Kre9/Knh1-like N-terminal domain-containing protein n=1 Tax=Basidiobolus meristosporus CBS 931.73 TaxID=1314790 RepID=A0A1Y1Z416_9FUNG|nr:hypothetical protein K493DRAFT_345465 [Basidiobolus meristosporus CBS 931.73]|eukprot:ORY04727.1 hypothetical protein K493DRAFT_345465 [Basidiobolus meristosporus CBS 931.73]
MRFTVAFLATFLSMAALNVQADISITSPVEGTRWYINSLATVNWRIISEEPEDASAMIELRRGNPNSLQTVEVLTDGVQVDDKSFSWKVPAKTQPGKDYAILVKINGKDFYSHMFEIANK